MTTEYDPELYHLLHRGNPGDTDWYEHRCQGAQNILELGCGDGRILLRLCQAGASVFGMDHSELMLTRCAERFHRAGSRVELIHGDMAAFALPWRFDRILIPYNSLYCLTTEAQQLACLRAVKAHLQPHGQLLLDAYAADPVSSSESLAQTVDEHVVASFHNGQRHIEVRERSEEDVASQRINATYDYYSTWDDGRTQLDSWSILQRYIFPQQLVDLLEQAELALEAIYGDFEHGVFTQTSQHMVVVASALKSKEEPTV